MELTQRRAQLFIQVINKVNSLDGIYLYTMISSSGRGVRTFERGATGEGSQVIYSFFFTLNFCTSSGFAILPSVTQVWKKDGATDTPNASAVIPVLALSEFPCITRNVPKSNTSKCWE
jgi:hypothetical protein